MNNLSTNKTKTVDQALNEAAMCFKNAGIDSYNIDARILLEHCLNATREQLIANKNKCLEENELNAFNILKDRRKSREPISLIIGKKEFWGHDFATNKHTLDPRPDSETLIETVIGLYSNRAKKLSILDLGTGTGCLLLSLLSEYPNSLGLGVDISQEALNLAVKNSESLGLERRGKFILSNWDEKIEGNFDIIISNPPYIKSEDIKALEPEVSNFDPLSALDGGEDGLSEYRKIASFVPSLLKENGTIILEIGEGQEQDVQKIFETENLKLTEQKKDLAGIIRCLIFSHLSSVSGHQ